MTNSRRNKNRILDNFGTQKEALVRLFETKGKENQEVAKYPVVPSTVPTMFSCDYLFRLRCGEQNRKLVSPVGDAADISQEMS